jgi:arsenate reductase
MLLAHQVVVAARDLHNMNLETTIASLKAHSISDKRKLALQPLIDYISAKKEAEELIRLNFICTHNSRRSQLAQVWSFVLSNHFDLNVESYSGGVEVTAFFPAAIEALKASGIEINRAGGVFPKYKVRYNYNEINCFSKLYNNALNPTEGFAAVMTCSDADRNCPLVSGAEKRIPMTFEDPKAFDDSPKKQEKYKERSLQIAGELYFVFNSIT